MPYERTYSPYTPHPYASSSRVPLHPETERRPLFRRPRWEFNVRRDYPHGFGGHIRCDWGLGPAPAEPEVEAAQVEAEIEAAEAEIEAEVVGPKVEAEVVGAEVEAVVEGAEVELEAEKENNAEGQALEAQPAEDDGEAEVHGNDSDFRMGTPEVSTPEVIELSSNSNEEGPTAGVEAAQAEELEEEQEEDLEKDPEADPEDFFTLHFRFI